jgi:hypothetical protein
VDSLEFRGYIDTRVMKAFRHHLFIYLFIMVATVFWLQTLLIKYRMMTKYLSLVLFCTSNDALVVTNIWSEKMLSKFVRV